MKKIFFIVLTLLVAFGGYWVCSSLLDFNLSQPLVAQEGIQPRLVINDQVWIGDVLNTLIWGVVIVSLAACAVFFVWVILPYVKMAIEALKPDPLEGIDDQTKDLLAAMADLDKTLAKISRNGDKAEKLIDDAKIQAEYLIKLVEGFVNKATDFRAEITEIKTVMGELSKPELNKVLIAEYANKLGDENLIRLAMMEMPDPRLVETVLVVFGARLGTLQKWEETYYVFSTRLLKQFSHHYNTAAKLEASLDLLGAVEPMAKISTSITTASRMLNFRTRPVEANVIKQIPAANARLLT